MLQKIIIQIEHAAEWQDIRRAGLLYEKLKHEFERLMTFLKSSRA
jgi:hypothetical protein